MEFNLAFKGLITAYWTPIELKTHKNRLFNAPQNIHNRPRDLCKGATFHDQTYSFVHYPGEEHLEH
jgi:hypothetical protein